LELFGFELSVPRRVILFIGKAWPLAIADIALESATSEIVGFDEIRLLMSEIVAADVISGVLDSASRVTGTQT
jgi:hypothetical protein